MTFHYHQMLVAREVGGAALIAFHLARRLRDEGGNCHVWVPGEGPALKEAKRLELPWHVFDAAGALGAAKLPAAFANWKLGRRLRKNGAGLIHVHGPLYYGALRRGLSLSGLTRVVHVQIEEDIDGLRWAFRSPPEYVVTCAQFLVDLVQRALPAEAQGRTRVVAIPNAVDTERFTPGPRDQAKKRLGAPGNRPLALMLANLAPHKGQETTIRAIALLKNRGVDVHCWLAGVERGGKEDYTQRLRSLIAAAGVGDRVELLGQRSDTPELLRAADFFLLPSTHEGLPLSILEAQATRVPVLAAATAGVPEVVQDGKTGFLIAADDAEAYARRMEQLLANPALREQIVNTAFDRTTREYSGSAFCQRMAALYREVIETSTSRRRPWFRFFG